MIGDVPDIEVGRHALRTFQFRDGLASLYQLTKWDKGQAIAECRRQPGYVYTWSSTEPLKLYGACPEPPGDRCDCGLYGTLTIKQLLREYSAYARHGIAVIAAEGATVIGTKGLKTAAARVVAWWAPVPGDGEAYSLMVTDWAERIFAHEVPEATRYATVDELLEAYRFDPMDEVDKKILDGNWNDHGTTASGLYQSLTSQLWQTVFAPMNSITSGLSGMSLTLDEIAKVFDIPKGLTAPYSNPSDLYTDDPDDDGLTPFEKVLKAKKAQASRWSKFTMPKWGRKKS